MKCWSLVASDGELIELALLPSSQEIEATAKAQPHPKRKGTVHKVDINYAAVLYVHLHTLRGQVNCFISNWTK